jgi:hypothetical protein
LTKDQKLDAWRNIIHHLTGHHENCLFADAPVRIAMDVDQGELMGLVIEFVRKTEWTVEWSD